MFKRSFCNCPTLNYLEKESFINKGIDCKIKYVKLRHSFYFSKVIIVRMFQYLTFLNNVAPTAQKMKISIKDLVTFTEEILTGKLHFLCSARSSKLH